MNKEKKVDNPIQQLNQDPFQIFFSSMLIGANIFDGEGKVIAVNSVARSYFGVSEDDPLTGYCLFDDPLISQDTKDKLRNGQIAREERWIDFETIQQHKMYNTTKTPDDRTLIELRYSPIGSDLNTPDGYSIIIQDITERKQAEAEITYQASLLGQIDSAVITIDFDNIILSWNSYAETLYQWSHDEAVGKNIIELLSPEEMKGMVGKNFEALNVDGHWEGEFNVLKKDGSTLPAHITNTYLKDIDGNNIGFIGISNDITERKQAENNLRESKNRYRALLENSPICIHEIDLNGKIVSMNRSGLDMLDLNNEADVLGLTYIDAVGADDRPIIEGLLRKALKGESSHFEFQGSNPERLVYYHSSFIPIENKDGEVVRLMGMSEDITERKQTEEKLLKDESILRLITENAFDFIWTLDMEMNITYASNSSKRLLGYLPEEITKINVSELYSTAQFQEIQMILMAEMVKGNPHSGIIFTTKHLRKDRTEFPVEVQAKIIYNKKSEPVFIQGYTRDISERKQAEDTLREIKTKQSAMISNISDVIGIIGEDGLMKYKSPNIEKWFGWQPQDLIASDGFSNVHLDDLERIQKEFSTLLEKENSSITVELRYKCKDGSYKPIELTATNLTNDPVINGVLLNYRDITERKQAEQERTTLEAKLRQSQKLEAIGTMVGGISHEFNNVLQSMFLHAGLVQDELPENEELRASFQHILDDGNRARDLIKQVLTFSRNAKVEMEPQPIHDMIMDVLVLERASLPANIDIQHDIDQNCSLVLCDKTQIHQIIMNLCNNARDAMGEKGGTLTVSLKPTRASLNNGDPEIDVLELIVSDTGHGIKASDLGRIFDPFFTAKEFGEGTGLGLSVIHGIVEMMEGQISVTSEPGKGTTFRILFPMTETVKEGEIAKSSAVPKPMSRRSILLVDDEDSIREAVKTILTNIGFDVDSAPDGQEALEVFKANPGKFDLLVTDQSMPKMSGVELTKAIRKDNPEVPIILSTGHLGIEDEQEFKNAGITAFIQKPWTAAELIERIRELDHN